MNKRYSIERLIRVYDDDTGSYIQIAPDSDGLDLVEIRQVTAKGVVERDMVMLPREFRIFVGACQEYTKFLPEF